MNKQELKQEKEELLFEIKNLNKENKQLKEQINDLNLKKFAIERPIVDLNQAKLVYEWLKFDPNEHPVEEEDQLKLWDEFLGMISWKFTPRENGEMELDLNLVYDTELKGKYKLVKL